MQGVHLLQPHEHGRPSSSNPGEPLYALHGQDADIVITAQEKNAHAILTRCLVSPETPGLPQSRRTAPSTRPSR